MEPEDPRSAEPTPPFPEQKQEHPGLETEVEPAPDFGETSYRGHARLEDRVALVTGADSGIGRAVALAFAREGADVAIAYLSEHGDAKKTREVVEAAGRKALTLAGDLADAAHRERLVKTVVETFGRIDLLVNNAAFQGEEMDSLEQLTADRIEHTLKVNVVAMLELVRLSLPHLQPGSAIINVTSIQAYDPTPGIVDYAASKGAIVTLTKALAKELLPRGIRVNAVAPGPVWTPIVPQSFEGKRVAYFGKGTPMGRPAQPVEVAPAFVFLASEDSRYVTGEVLGVTGGRLLP